MFMAGHIIAHADEKRLVLQMGLIGKLDVEVKSIVAVVGLLLSHIVVELSNDLGSRLPVIECEPSDDVLAECNICTSDDSNEHFLIGCQENPLDSDSSGISLETAGGKVC